MRRGQPSRSTQGPAPEHWSGGLSPVMCHHPLLSRPASPPFLQLSPQHTDKKFSE